MSWNLSAFADEAGPSLAEQIRALHDAGLTRVDLRMIGDTNVVDLTPDAARQIRSALAESGIAVAMFGSPIGKIDITSDFAVDLKRLDNLARLGDILGCRAVRIFSYYNKDHKPQSEFASVSLDRLTKLRDNARKLGLKLYHENETAIFGESCAHVLQIADAVYDGESFDLIFDFDNFNRCNEDCWDNWVKLRDRTGAIHLKDSTAMPDGVHVPVGEGAGQVRKILADAAERGWAGPVSIEPHLKHSKAVLATHVSGEESQAYSEMTPAETFAIAADAAQRVLRELGIACR